MGVLRESVILLRRGLSSAIVELKSEATTMR